jgi:hypothetical protein
MAASDEKRQAQRIQPFVAPCRFVLGEERFPGFLTDISVEGARVRSEVEPPPVGTAVAVEARFGRQVTHLPFPATVRWARPISRGGFVFGVSFEKVGSEEQKVLDSVVAEFQRRAASIS